MADEYILKSYDGGAETTTLTTPFTAGGTTLVVANGSTFPDGSSGPFVVVVDRGLATEEKFLIDTTTGVNGVTFNIQQAAYDGTSASNHATGAVVEHCLDAYSIEQANRYVNLQTAKGDLVAHNGTTATKLSAGTNNHVLMADSAQSVGLKFAQIGTASIANDAIDSTKLADASVTASKIDASGSPTAGQVLTANPSVTPGLEWTTPAAGFTMPAGSIIQYAGATAPSGWLLCDGSSVSRTTYASLFTALGGVSSPYGGITSTNFNLPDFRSRFPVGKGTSAWSDALGESGGSAILKIVDHYHDRKNHQHDVLSVGDAVATGTIQVYQSAGGGALANSVTGYAGGTAGGTISNGATNIPAGDHKHEILMSFDGDGATSNQKKSDLTPMAGETPDTNTANLPPYITVNYLIKT